MFQLIFINPSGRISQNCLMLQDKHAVACTRVYTVCLHLEQAFETLLEEIKLDTDILEKHSFYNLNWSCFKHTVACSNITMPCCVTAVGLCKIIEKSVMGESFVFCPAKLDPRPDFR